MPGNDYKAFLRSHSAKRSFIAARFTISMEISLLNTTGSSFTIGQRKGLPGGSQGPRYVVHLDPETNRVIVGDADELNCDEFQIDRVN